MKSGPLLIYLLAVLSMLFWGFSFVWFKIVVEAYEPITIIFLRLVISSAILLAFVKLSGRLQKIHRQDFRWLLLLAFTQPLCYFLGESFGLKYVSSTVGSVIISTIPVFSPLVAFYTLKEKITALNLAGIVLSFLGVVVMLLNRDLSLNADLKGVFLLFVAVAAALAYSVVIRKLAWKYSTFTIITYQNIFGAMYFFPLFLIFDFRHFLTVRPGTEVILSLVQLAVFASSLAYLFYIAVIRELGMTRANIFTNFIPVFTAVFSYFVLSEYFNFYKIIGIVIVVSGVFLSNANRLMRRIRPDDMELPPGGSA